MSILHFYKASVYGNDLLYPLEQEFVVAHALISGRKTLTAQDFEGYLKLGVKLKEGDNPNIEKSDEE